MPEAAPDPDAVSKVEVFPDLEWAWNGFWRLSNSRPQGMNGYLRIPLSEVEAYGRLHGFDYARRIEFLSFVEQMDEAFMAHVEKLREEEQRKTDLRNKQPPKPKRR